MTKEEIYKEIEKLKKEYEENRVCINATLSYLINEVANIKARLEKLEDCV